MNKHKCKKNCKGIGFEIVGKYKGETCNYCHNKIKLDELAVYPHMYRSTQAGQSGWYHIDCVREMTERSKKIKSSRLKKCRICNSQKKESTYVTLPTGPAKTHAHVSCMTKFLNLTENQKLKHIIEHTINRFSIKRAKERYYKTGDKSIQNIIGKWEIKEEWIERFGKTLEAIKVKSWGDNYSIYIKGEITDKKDLSFIIDNELNESINLMMAPLYRWKCSSSIRSMSLDLKTHYEETFEKRFAHILGLYEALKDCLFVNETISLNNKMDKFRLLQKFLQKKINDEKAEINNKNISILLSDNSVGIRNLAMEWYNTNRGEDK